MAKIINMTPHPVVLLDENGQEIHTFPMSGQTIRLSVTTVEDEPIEVIKENERVIYTDFIVPTSRTVFGEPVGLPYPVYDDIYSPSIYYIVSQLVKNALPNRGDLLVPAEVVRDEKGNILGCKSLGR